MVEGLGDEVLISLVFFIFFLIPIVYFAFSRRNTGNVHPENQQNIDHIRPFLSNVDLLPIQNGPSAPPLITGDNIAGTSEIETIGMTSTYRPQNFRRYYCDSQCPICLNNAHFPVETNCGHMFCGSCLIIYWQHGRWGIYAMSCPVCRQTITLIIPCFSTTAATETDTEAMNKVVGDINNYNRRFSDMPRSVLDYVYDLPVLLRHACTEFFTVNGLMLMFRVRIALCFAGALLYLVSPFDIVPEAIFGLFGLLDDLLVLLLVAVYASITYRHVISDRASASSGSTADQSSNRDFAGDSFQGF